VTEMLGSASWALFVCWIAVLFRWPGRERLFYGLGSATAGAFALFYLLTKTYTLGSLNAGSCGMFIWLWWRSGGGDDTKRRLRKLGQAFTGVRRTAPAAARVVWP